MPLVITECLGPLITYQKEEHCKNTANNLMEGGGGEGEAYGGGWRCQVRARVIVRASNIAACTHINVSP